MWNPYLEEVIELQGRPRITIFDDPGFLLRDFEAGNDPFSRRQRLTKRYAWAVPDEAAIDAIARLGMPIVEVGAGNGYWGRLLRERGVACHLYDAAPQGNEWCDGHSWTDVVVGGPEVVLYHPDAALLLCWPPHGEPMARRCIDLYAGDVVVYVGEWGGATADAEFHERLVAHFEEEASVDIPQYWGLHDYLWVYRRRRRLPA